MLVLSRKLGEKIYIGEAVCITVVDIDRGKIRLGIDAPRETPIYRHESLPWDFAQRSPAASPTKSVTLELDSDDYDALQRAMAVRQGFGVLPEGGGNLAGRVVAEICRGYLEMLDAKQE